MKILLITIFILCLSFAAHAQTVCISQEAADKCVENTQKLDQAQKLIDQFLIERKASDLALAKATQVIEIDKLLLQMKDEIIALKDRKELAYKELDAIKDKIIQTLLDLNEKLTAKMMQPKSTLQKFLDGVKEILKAVVYIGAGAAIGRVL